MAKLLFARHTGKEFEKVNFGALRTAVESYMVSHHIWEAKVAYKRTIIEKSNWKLIWEDNREWLLLCRQLSGTRSRLSENQSVTGTDGGVSDPGISSRWRVASSPACRAVSRSIRKASSAAPACLLIGEAES